jgi:hypothetical protein
MKFNSSGDIFGPGNLSSSRRKVLAFDKLCCQLGVGMLKDSRLKSFGNLEFLLNQCC